MIIESTETFDQNKIANVFLNFFAEIGPKFVSSVSNNLKNLQNFVSTTDKD